MSWKCLKMRILFQTWCLMLIIDSFSQPGTLFCPAVPCPALLCLIPTFAPSCPALPCPALPCSALLCSDLPCPALLRSALIRHVFFYSVCFKLLMFFISWPQWRWNTISVQCPSSEVGPEIRQHGNRASVCCFSQG